MNSITEEIQQLQIRLIELEKQKKEAEINYKKKSINHNFTVMNELLSGKTQRDPNLKYDTPFKLQCINQSEIILYLEAIYNVLHLLDDRLKELEK